MKNEKRESRGALILGLIIGLFVGAIIMLPIATIRGSKVGFESGYIVGQLEMPRAVESTPYIESAVDEVLAIDGAVVLASFYGSESGELTANGEHYNPEGFTAAHRSFPFNTFVVAENLDNGRYATVRINDRGPNKRLHRRGIDVSHGAALELDMVKKGLAVLRLHVIGAPGTMVAGRTIPSGPSIQD